MEITTNLKRRRDIDDIIRGVRRKSKVISQSPNQKSNLKQNPNAQHKSFHFNPHTLNIPNTQKPPILNTSPPLTYLAVLPVSFRDERTKTIIIIVIIKKKNKVSLNWGPTSFKRNLFLLTLIGITHHRPPSKKDVKSAYSSENHRQLQDHFISLFV